MESKIIKILIQEYQSGTGLKKLAVKHHMDWLTVRRVLQENGIETRKPTPKILDESEAVRLYQQGMNTCTIAKKFNIASNTVRKKLIDAGVDRRPPEETSRQYPINPSQLIDLSSEIGSYWFGFLLADGYINPKYNVVRIDLHAKDAGHLWQLCRDAHTITPPHHFKQHYKGKIHERIRLSLCSKGLSSFYRECGWHDFKNGIVDKLKSLPLDRRHFIRGLWDGDGIVTHSGNLLRMGFCDKYHSVVEWVSNELIVSCAVNSNKIGRHNNASYTFWGGRPAVHIARWLYTNQSRCLKRKMDKIYPYLVTRSVPSSDRSTTSLIPRPS